MWPMGFCPYYASDTTSEKKLVDFKLLVALAEESKQDYGTIIAAMEMQNIPMSDAVRKLGVVCGVLNQ